MDYIHNVPTDIWNTIKDSDMKNDEDTAKLRNYFSAPHMIDPTKKTIVMSTPSRTGTSWFRIETPMYAIKRNYPDEFNLVYADGNLGPNHVAVADLIVFHRAGGHHDFLHKIFKVWPKTKKRPLIVHDVDDEN